MIRRPRPAPLATALALAACASSPAPSPAPAPAGDAGAHAHHTTELPATAGPGYTVADVRFMQHMIGHHAQAIAMAALVPGRAAGDDIRRLAQKIDISQKDEIDMMERWLAERGQAVPDSAQRSGMHMPGMLTDGQLARLAAARGRDFDRLFLDLMIQHHLGALEMVDTLFASPGAAQDSDIFRFATDVAVDQRDEIGVMEHMLDRLDPPRRSEPE